MAAFIVVGLGWGSFAALVPPVKAQIGASDALYGGLLLIASLGALAAMWLAPLAFRLAGRWAVVVGALMIGLGFVLVGIAVSPLFFVCAMLLATIGSGITDVLANAEVAEREAEHDRALMNLNHGLYSFAFAGAALMSGLLREASWTPVDVLSLVAICVVCLCCLMFTPKAAVAPLPDASAPVPVLPRVLVWLGGCVVLSAFLAEAATEGWSALHLERTLGGDAGHGALGPALFGVTMGIGRLFGHGLANRFSDIWLMTVACLMAAVGLGLAGAAPSITIAYVGFACAGLGISVVVPLAFALIGRSVPDALRLAAIARASALGYAAFFLGPPAMGAVSHLFGLRASFGMIAVLLVAVALVLIPALARQVAGPK